MDQSKWSNPPPHSALLTCVSHTRRTGTRLFIHAEYPRLVDYGSILREVMVFCCMEGIGTWQTTNSVLIPHSQEGRHQRVKEDGSGGGNGIARHLAASRSASGAAA